MLVPAAAYARYSSSLQDEMSIRGQIDEINKWAKTNGYLIVKEFVDEAERGSSETREAFNALKKEVQSGKADFRAIIAWKSSRIARKVEHAQVFRSLMARQNVDLLFVSEPNIEGPVGKLVGVILDGINEFYSDQLGEEVLRGTKAAVRRGYSPGGTPPYGYKKITVECETGAKKKKLVPDEERAPIVSEVYKMYAEGVSLVEIADKLNSSGIKSSRGGKWKSSTIWNMLFLYQKAYLGMVTYNKFGRSDPAPGSGLKKGNTPKFKKPKKEWIIKENAHEPIITKELAEAVNAVRKSKPIDQNINKKSKKAERRVLSGLLFCGICEGKYGLTNGARRADGTRARYYRCGKISRPEIKSLKKHKNRWLNAERTEEKIIKIVSEKISKGDLKNNILQVLKNLDKTQSEGSILKKMHEEKASLELKLNRILDSIADGILPKELAAQKITSLNSALLIISEKIIEEENKKKVPDKNAKQILLEAVAFLDSVQENWQAKETSANAILNALVDKIFVYPSKIKICWAMPISPDIFPI